MLHPVALLRLHRGEHAQRFILVGDDLERRRGIAGEYAPAALQLLAHGALQRKAPGVEILAGGDDIAVQRARPCAIRAAPADWAGRRASTGILRRRIRSAPPGNRRSAWRNILPHRARGLGIARRGGAEQRRVVIGEIEIGGLDDADAVVHPADQRQQHGLFAGRGVRDDGDQRLDAVVPWRTRRTTPPAIASSGTASHGRDRPSAPWPVSSRA